MYRYLYFTNFAKKIEKNKNLPDTSIDSKKLIIRKYKKAEEFLLLDDNFDEIILSDDEQDEIMGEEIYEINNSDIVVEKCIFNL